MPQIPPELAPGEPPFDDQALDLALDPEVRTSNFLDPHDGDRVERARRWEVVDDGAAEWALRMLAAIATEEQGIRDQYAIWLEPIVAWRDEQLGRLEPRAAFFDGHLRRYGLERRAADPKRATIALPSGKITTRAASGPQVDIVDEAVFVEWAAKNLEREEWDQVVRVSYKALISEIRKRVTIVEHDDGDSTVVWAASAEFVPGLAASVPATTASVTLAK